MAGDDESEKTPKRRNRPPVLISMKVSELSDLVGLDAEITVGRTRLAELLTARQIDSLIGEPE